MSGLAVGKGECQQGQPCPLAHDLEPPQVFSRLSAFAVCVPWVSGLAYTLPLPLPCTTANTNPLVRAAVPSSGFLLPNLLSNACPPSSPLLFRSVFPNASAKPKGERQALIADQIVDSKEVSQLQLRRPFDRVGGRVS